MSELITRDEIALHVFAQLTRFVVRKQMRRDTAAVFAFLMADEFIEARRITESYIVPDLYENDTEALANAVLEENLVVE